jgi:hypothetical protein
MKLHEIQIDYSPIDIVVVQDLPGNGSPSKPWLTCITDDMTGSVIGAVLTVSGSDEPSQLIVPLKDPGEQEAEKGSNEPV